MTIQIKRESQNSDSLGRLSSISSRTLLWGIILLAVSLRILSALYQGNTVTDLPGIFDQISYDGLARRVVQGHGFSFAEDHWPATRGGEPTAHWSFLYTLYLALVYKLAGFYPLLARLIQAVAVGIIQPLLIWRIGKRLFNQTVGIIAAALTAIYIYFFYYAGALITEPFYITTILWTFDSAFRIADTARAGREGRLWQWLELGIAIGLTVLLRQLFLLFLPFLFFWLWFNIQGQGKDGWRRTLRWNALKGLIVVTTVLLLMILPFIIRNYRAFGTFVLLNTNAGFAFFWGNHPIQGTHFIPILSVSYQSLIPTNLLPLNEAMLDKALLQEGIKIVLGDPIRYVLLSFSRIEEYIKFWPSRDSSLISNLSRVGSFGLLLPFMLYGLWVSFSKFRRPETPGQKADLLAIYMFIAVYTLIHLLTWTLIRYRLPIDAFLILFAAVGIENLIQRSHLRLKA